MSESYFLSPHVHVCVAGKHVVLLDLRRDKYIAVVPSHRLARWVKGWPVSEPPAALGSAPAEIGESARDPSREDGLLSKMVAQGMLVTDPNVGKEAIPVVTERPEATLIGFDLDTHPRTSLAHLWNFVAAHTAAKSALKFRPIRSVVHAAARARKAGPGELDIGTARDLVAAFVHLRPLFFTAYRACLLDSLSLIKFLARYRLHPEWVFGVKTNPFFAHCWVQHGEVVFNDNPDYVRGFTPILVV
jgi:hypothetical protein